MVHPCNGERALKGFGVMMAALRSAATGGESTLPLGRSAEPELDALKKVLDARDRGPARSEAR